MNDDQKQLSALVAEFERLVLLVRELENSQNLYKPKIVESASNACKSIRELLEQIEPFLQQATEQKLGLLTYFDALQKHVSDLYRYLRKPNPKEMEQIRFPITLINLTNASEYFVRIMRTVFDIPHLNNPNINDL